MGGNVLMETYFYNLSIVANDLWPPSCNDDQLCDETWCSWVQVPVRPDVLLLDVPCGLPHHTPVVASITIIITLLGSIHIIGMIRYVYTCHCV